MGIFDKFFGPPNIEKLKEKRDVEGLIKALSHEDADTRSKAAEALGDLKDARAVETLIARLKDKDSVVRKTAANALGKLADARAVEPLVAALKDENPDVRAAAAVALGMIGDARAVKPLAAALKDEVWEVRNDAARSLGWIGDAQAVKPLLADEDLSVRYAAADALKTMAWQPTSANQRVLYAIAAQDLGAAVAEGAAAVEPLVAALKDASQSPDLLLHWVKALKEIKDLRAVDPLIALIDGEQDYRIVCEAARALGNIGDHRALEPLIDGLKYNRAVREQVVWTLGKLGNPRAIEPLRELLETESDERVIHEANQALTKLKVAARGGEPTVAELIELQDWDKLVSMGKSAVGSLIDTLENTNNDSIARKIIEVLGKIKDVRAIEPLVKILNSMEQKIKAMGGSIPGITMDQYRYNQHAILLALGNITEDKSVYEIVSRAAETLSPVTQQDWQSIVHRALKTANKGDIV
ncbi:MAG: HEAT repeat domain-containing protein [Thermodesulfovibrionales bacterium]|nr:HEAT repeat domain-containing protein [Thermodesulfovibrionales bacterium]